MTSYVTDGSVGPWAKLKLDCLHDYLQAYTTIMKNQTRWCSGYVYVDAFAGGGKAPLRSYSNDDESISLLDEVAEFVQQEETEATQYVIGSPRVALDVDFPFTEYVFIEKNSNRIEELLKLKQQYGNTRNITILQGDANRLIKSHFFENGHYNWETHRAVAFLDPFGMQVPWQTLQLLGRTSAIELILNLPVGMAIQRLLPNSGEFSSKHKLMLNEYFGSSAWEKIVYEQQPSLFGTQTVKKRDSGEQLARWYQKRLGAEYGYCPKPRLIKNTRGAHLYYLLWAGPKKVAARIAEHVLRQGEII
ncbi:three-Cys-motif partner protein TcmP [Kordiimonas sp.]|uniref:three-Cys-motif partner protein TcmP n=1 Tax=Kordiimonas sp. TaxID=1970157 RepID=UPI003A8E34FD